MINYLVASIKSWNRDIYETVISNYPGNWFFISVPGELTVEYLEKVNPQYIFFLHWSDIVPKEITSRWDCICFHMTDLPYGRGGSPLQNLIMQGHTDTKISALKMTDKVDAGPIYCKEDLSLSGSAETIFRRASAVEAEMIKTIINNNSTPVPQEGEITEFKRRLPEQSRIPENSSVNTAYDIIRMLDAEGYPKAFIQYGNFKLEFSDALFDNNCIEAKVTIIEDNK